jgi:hypothetical protein
MSLHRFLCPDLVPEGDRVRIEGAVVAQIRKVLRLGPGDRVILFGADEWEYTVRLEYVERDAALGAVIGRAAPQAEPRCELTLSVALLKGETTEWVLQKGSELGGGRSLPRTSAGPPGGRSDTRGSSAKPPSSVGGFARPASRVSGHYRKLWQSPAATGPSSCTNERRSGSVINWLKKAFRKRLTNPGMPA